MADIGLWDIVHHLRRKALADMDEAERGAPTVLHCCGNTDDRITYFAEAGFDAYHFESQVNIAGAVEVALGKMRLIGNINNAEVLLKGTEEEVAAACRAAIAGGVDILAPECAVPLATPVRNLKVLVEVAEEGEGFRRERWVSGCQNENDRPLGGHSRA